MTSCYIPIIVNLHQDRNDLDRSSVVPQYKTIWIRAALTLDNVQSQIEVC